MLFNKTYSELMAQAMDDLEMNTDITNMNAGGVARTLIEVMNTQLAEHYTTLDVNQAMGFLSTADGYFLDLIGELLNTPRLEAGTASASYVDKIQKFYVPTGFLGDYIPSLVIPTGTTVSSPDQSIIYNTSETTSFSAGAKYVYVSIVASAVGATKNVGRNILVSNGLGIAEVFTTNESSIVTGTDTESDNNYRYRIANATLAAERANETAVRLAALSVDGVANIILEPYARGIGSYEVLVLPIEGIATTTLVAAVQTSIDGVQAYGIRGFASSPDIVPVDIEVRIVFIDGTTEVAEDRIRLNVKTAIEQYTSNIPIGGEFILNELRQQIMDVSEKIKDHNIHCYYFREQPHLLGNVEIEHDERFYPNPNSPEAIIVA